MLVRQFDGTWNFAELYDWFQEHQPNLTTLHITDTVSFEERFSIYSSNNAFSALFRQRITDIVLSSRSIRCLLTNWRPSLVNTSDCVREIVSAFLAYLLPSPCLHIGIKKIFLALITFLVTFSAPSSIFWTLDWIHRGSVLKRSPDHVFITRSLACLLASLITRCHQFLLIRNIKDVTKKIFSLDNVLGHILPSVFNLLDSGLNYLESARSPATRSRKEVQENAARKRSSRVKEQNLVVRIMVERVVTNFQEHHRNGPVPVFCQNGPHQHAQSHW